MGTPKLPIRTCACGCQKTFRPHVKTEKYLNAKHRNRAGQERLRERAKRASELMAEQAGAFTGAEADNG